jgi:O-methyltransferase
MAVTRKSPWGLFGARLFLGPERAAVARPAFDRIAELEAQSARTAAALASVTETMAQLERSVAGTSRSLNMSIAALTITQKQQAEQIGATLKETTAGLASIVTQLASTHETTAGHVDAHLTATNERLATTLAALATLQQKIDPELTGTAFLSHVATAIDTLSASQQSAVATVEERLLAVRLQLMQISDGGSQQAQALTQQIAALEKTLDQRSAAIVDQHLAAMRQQIVALSDGSARQADALTGHVTAAQQELIVATRQGAERVMALEQRLEAARADLSQTQRNAAERLITELAAARAETAQDRVDLLGASTRHAEAISTQIATVHAGMTESSLSQIAALESQIAAARAEAAQGRVDLLGASTRHAEAISMQIAAAYTSLTETSRSQIVALDSQIAAGREHLGGALARLAQQHGEHVSGAVGAAQQAVEQLLSALMNTGQAEARDRHTALLGVLTGLADTARGDAASFRGSLSALDAQLADLAVAGDVAVGRLLGRISSLATAYESQLSTGSAASNRLYLDLLEADLTGDLNAERIAMPLPDEGLMAGLREIGRMRIATAMTMIGPVRLRNLRHLCEMALVEEIPGDFMEVGVWRGGAGIYMCGVLRSAGDRERHVLLADSFQGPPLDQIDDLQLENDRSLEELAVSRGEVEDNFRRYGLLDERVVFVEGWFADTLTDAPTARLALLRIDADTYAGTRDALTALYGRLSNGAFVIIDDLSSPGPARAVAEFRDRLGITSPMVEVDGSAVWWRTPRVGAGSGRTSAD